MPLARVNDVTLSYTVQGDGDWLVLIGGYASSNWTSWGALLDTFAKSYRVLAFDNRGIGQSEVPDYPYTTPMLARDVIGLMDHLGIDNARVFGKSLGGAIAQWLALLAPHRVRSLVMTSTTSRLDRRAARMVEWWMATARDSGFEVLFRGELTYFYTAEYYEAHPDAIERAERALIDVHRPLNGFLHMGQALLTHDTFDRLHEIAAPTLLICGEDDMITPARHTEEMGRRMSNAQVHVVPHTLHGITSERPEIIEVIQRFLRSN